MRFKLKRSKNGDFYVFDKLKAWLLGLFITTPMMLFFIWEDVNLSGIIYLTAFCSIALILRFLIIKFMTNAPIAQLDRALSSGGKG